MELRKKEMLLKEMFTQLTNVLLSICLKCERWRDVCFMYDKILNLGFLFHGNILKWICIFNLSSHWNYNTNAFLRNWLYINTRSSKWCDLMFYLLIMLVRPQIGIQQACRKTVLTMITGLTIFHHLKNIFAF